MTGARSILILAVVALLLLLAVGGLKGYRELSAAREREAELEARLLATRAGVDRLKHRIERLKEDPGLLEQLARDELMMVRPGEVVVVYPREAEPPPPAAPSDATPPERAGEPEARAGAAGI